MVSLGAIGSEGERNAITNYPISNFGIWFFWILEFTNNLLFVAGAVFCAFEKENGVH